MMTSTHALVGAFLGAGAAAAFPELSATAVLVGFVGGALPDVDLVATHRRTAHFPVLAPAVALPATVAALVVGTPVALLAAVFVIAVAAHCLMDVFGGGVEHRPWEATSDRGVYDHVSGRWIRPRRWVRWAGAPEDFVLSLAWALPTLALTRGRVRTALVVVLVLSGAFVLVRRRLPALTERLFGDAVDP